MAKIRIDDHILLVILIGILLGGIWILSPGCLFMLTLGIICAVMLWRFSNPEDRRFIMAIFIVGISLRIIVYLSLTFIAVLFQKDSGLWLIGDSWGIYNYAWAWAQQMHDPTKLRCLQEAFGGYLYLQEYNLAKDVWQYGYSGFTYLLGTIYYFFGPLKFSPRLLNCLMGVGSGIFIYHITKEIFGRGCAKLSAVLTIFMPSLFLWSLLFMKDISFIFTGCVILWSFLRFQKTKRMYFLSILFLAILAQSSIRPSFPALFIIAVFAVTYFIVSAISWKKKIAISLCLLILMLPVIQRTDVRKLVNNQALNILNYSRGVINTGGSTYNVFADKYYMHGSMSKSNYISFIDFVRGLFKGWLYLLLAPFPWRVSTGLQLISYVQIILWYLLIPFVLIGMIVCLRYRWKQFFVLFTYIITFGSIIALHSGNIGTLFRHRDILAPLFFIFASIGLIKIFGRLDNFKQQGRNP